MRTYVVFFHSEAGDDGDDLNQSISKSKQMIHNPFQGAITRMIGQHKTTRPSKRPGI